MRLACSILGLEKADLMNCSSVEHRNFRWISYGFILMMCGILISNFYFFSLLGISLLGELFGALIMTFIAFCILRFSFISVGIALHENVTFKTAILNSGNLFKFPLFLFFLFVFSVPLFTLFHHSEFNHAVEVEKQSLIKEHEIQNNKTIQSNLTYINKKILNSKNQMDSLRKLRTSCTDDEENIALTVQYDAAFVHFEQDSTAYFRRKEVLEFEYAHELGEYSLRIASIDFPFMRFLMFLNDGNKSLFLYLFIALIFALLPFYIYTMCSEHFLYLRLSNSRKKEFVINRYESMNIELKKYYLNKYNFEWDSPNTFNDPPFNQKLVSSKNKPIEDFDLFEHFKELP
jgi:hypothetical protein